MIERYETVVIGGGQAGLATGYYLHQHDQDFVILDASDRVGDAWRARWDSLRVFTPARYSSLPGMDFPGSPHAFPTKDEVADYLETYAQRFDLPVELGVRVDGLERSGDRFLITAGDRRIEATNVVVAMASYQAPKVPAFASKLSDDVVQLHTSDYRNPEQLQDGACSSSVRVTREQRSPLMSSTSTRRGCLAGTSVTCHSTSTPGSAVTWGARS
ncbi:flavin-containing monooxygenase [Haladaptatus sp. GCM10025707]|uniref:flavin-containing monooxygenase n=1 Tax=Haladaptatus sp. GCM10025707 TaxID=3252658 RepID=UPI0036221346